MLNDEQRKELLDRLEEYGENEIRIRIVGGQYQEDKSAFLQEVLRQKENERQEQRYKDSQALTRKAIYAAWFSAIAAAISALSALASFLLDKILNTFFV